MLSKSWCRKPAASRRLLTIFSWTLLRMLNTVWAAFWTMDNSDERRENCCFQLLLVLSALSLFTRAEEHGLISLQSSRISVAFRYCWARPFRPDPLMRNMAGTVGKGVRAAGLWASMFRGKGL